MKNKIPNINIQAPEKLQATICNQRAADYWSLGFEVSLELGAWNLELPFML
jgi:hypothetical protein